MFQFCIKSKALAQISAGSAAQAIGIFDKVGLGAIYEFLGTASTKVQSLILCLIGIVIRSGL